MSQTSIESQLTSDAPWCPQCFLHGHVNPVYSDPENDFFGCDACSMMWTRDDLAQAWNEAEAYLVIRKANMMEEVA